MCKAELIESKHEHHASRVEHARARKVRGAREVCTACGSKICFDFEHCKHIPICEACGKINCIDFACQPKLCELCGQPFNPYAPNYEDVGHEDFKFCPVWLEGREWNEKKADFVHCIQEGSFDGDKGWGRAEDYERDRKGRRINVGPVFLIRVKNIWAIYDKSCSIQEFLSQEKAQEQLIDQQKHSVAEIKRHKKFLEECERLNLEKEES